MDLGAPNVGLRQAAGGRGSSTHSGSQWVFVRARRGQVSKWIRGGCAAWANRSLGDHLQTPLPRLGPYGCGAPKCRVEPKGRRGSRGPGDHLQTRKIFEFASAARLRARSGQVSKWSFGTQRQRKKHPTLHTPPEPRGERERATCLLLAACWCCPLPAGPFSKEPARQNTGGVRRTVYAISNSCAV